MKTTLLITGGNGFIGSGLIHHFAKKTNFSVIGSIRFNLNHVFPDSVRIITNLDVDSEDVWLDAFNAVECVIHCAARYHIKNESTSDLLSICRNINVVGTMRLAKLAAKAGVRRFIYLSSLKVNGEFSRPGMPFLEEDIPNPFYPYGISKLEAEIELLKFSSSSSMDVVIIRPPPVYGPGVKANFLTMMRFLDYCIPLPLGRIQNLRSYIGISNLISFIELCIKHPNASNQIFFVSDDHDLSTSKLLAMMSHALRKPSVLIPAPQNVITSIANVMKRKYIPELLFGNFQSDITKAKRLLGWKPVESVEDGLYKTAAYYLKK